MYFADSLQAAVSGLIQMLKPKGKILILYSVFNFLDGEALEADKTNLAKAFDNLELKYKNIECTKRMYNHMKLKRLTAEKLQPAFLKEGNQFLYNNIIKESIDKSMDFPEFKTKFARYIYIITK